MTPTRVQEVLIVEDDLPIQKLLAALATRSGLEPIVASDGRSALQLLASADYDAMVLDLNLPGVNGFDVLRHVASENPALLDRTIVITSADERLYRNSPHVRHTHRLLRKPFDIATLQHEILACCHSH
jgi:DNA-binding response OmpR family regulator